MVASPMSKDTLVPPGVWPASASLRTDPPRPHVYPGEAAGAAVPKPVTAVHLRDTWLTHRLQKFPRRSDPTVKRLHEPDPFLHLSSANGQGDGPGQLPPETPGPTAPAPHLQGQAQTQNTPHLLTKGTETCGSSSFPRLGGTHSFGHLPGRTRGHRRVCSHGHQGHTESTPRGYHLHSSMPQATSLKAMDF